MTRRAYHRTFASAEINSYVQLVRNISLLVERVFLSFLRIFQAFLFFNKILGLICWGANVAIKLARKVLRLLFRPFSSSCVYQDIVKRRSRCIVCTTICYIRTFRSNTFNISKLVLSHIYTHMRAHAYTYTQIHTHAHACTHTIVCNNLRAANSLHYVSN